MSDFFGALELELRHAAKRRPRRPVGVGQVIGIVAAAALVAIAFALTMTVRGGGGQDERGQFTSGGTDPVGTVIPKGEGSPPRPKRSIVVARGRSRGIGLWQLEASRSERLTVPDTGEELQPAGLRCLTIFVVKPPADDPTAASGQCGEFPRTPGFSRLQYGQSRVLVFGRVPERAAAVQVLVPGRASIPARIHEGPKTSRGDFYAVSVKPPLPGARINWFEASGEPGSRGHRLMPPVTR